MGFNFEVNRFTKDVERFEAVYKSTNSKQRTMNHELRTDKAFTLIELVVAVALLAMVLGFASVIFRVSIEAYRTAGANTEIMQKLRAITDQLNADFKGQIWNPQGKVLFHYDDKSKVRSDSIAFFANGDFQSTGQYDDKTVVGNVACIYYGLADIPTYSSEEKLDPKKKILVRRQTILTADSDLGNLNLDPPGEYYTEKSLADLIADQAASSDGNTPEMSKLTKRPELDPNSEDDLVMYMAKGVDDFAIQYVDGTGKEFNKWRPGNEDIKNASWENKFFTPLAFKFTFTLYDSKGIIEKGRRFTHIVYLRD